MAYDDRDSSEIAADAGQLKAWYQDAWGSFWAREWRYDLQAAANSSDIIALSDHTRQSQEQYTAATGEQPPGPGDGHDRYCPQCGCAVGQKCRCAMGCVHPVHPLVGA